MVNGAPKLLKPEYFSKRADGSKINFYDHCYTPFLRDFADALKKVDPSLLFLFEPVPNEEPPVIPPGTFEDGKVVYSPHWYDLSAVFNKSFDGYITHDVQGLSKVTTNNKGQEEYHHCELLWTDGSKKELHLTDK
jgi:hypothetical protein